MYGVKWRKQYADAGRDDELAQASAIDFSESQDLTLQQCKDDSDINVLMRRFGVTGEIPRSSVEPFYGDFSEAFDYQTALNMVREAGEAFDSLPAKVRRRFHDNPAELMAFLHDPDNRDEAIELGLAEAPPRVVSEPPGGGSEPSRVGEAGSGSE